MLRILLSVAFVSITLSAHAEPVVVEQDALRELIRDAEDSAQRAEKELAKIPKAFQSKGAKSALVELRDQLEKLHALVDKAKPVTSPAPAPQPKPCLASATGAVIGAEAFEGLLGRVTAAPFNNDRLVVLDGAVLEHLFTVEQVRKLIVPFRFANDQISALQRLVPRIADLTIEGRAALLGAFPLSGDKQKVQALLLQCQ